MSKKLTVSVERETDRAILAKSAGEDESIWLPKSQVVTIAEHVDEIEIEIPDWLWDKCEWNKKK